MSRISYIMFLLIVSLVFATSCKKNEELNIPQIKMWEFGFNNERVAYVGDDLYVKAEIIAEGKIDYITIEIHPEDSHGINNDSVWDYNNIYFKYVGLQNVILHEYIGIPLDADTGSYHFKLHVVDIEGSQANYTNDLLILATSDSIASNTKVITHSGK